MRDRDSESLSRTTAKRRLVRQVKALPNKLGPAFDREFQKVTEAYMHLRAFEKCETDQSAYLDYLRLGHDGQAPGLSPAWLKPGGLCYDMNYGAASTPLHDACNAQGIPYSDGLGMLVGQAALSFELWTGRVPDSATVLRELRSTPG